ncbi:alpha/beta fold hydrolase [Methylophilus flavus]|uniref:Alpha/beta fold hydrolase n=1 Tax=Methylophilus flavus TaxID=640084 RepID=A0ABW3PE20_9PROT
MTRKNIISSNWANGVCRANDININYLRTGGNKPPLIALHGLAGSGACWSQMARALEKDYDVIMPDARGHGLSSAPSHGYTYQDHANDVIELIRTLGIKSPYLLGHSMGGMTAAMVASRLGFAISGLVLADPTFISPEWQEGIYESGVVDQHLQLLKSTKEALFREAKARHRYRSSELIEHIIQARLQTNVKAFDVLIPPNPEFDELIRNVYVPTLLVLGSEGIVSSETALELHKLNPDLQYKLIPDAGHGLPYDEPARLAAAVDAFLRPVATAVKRVKTHTRSNAYAASFAY